MNERELIQRVAVEVIDTPPMHLAVTPMTLFRLVGLLQLASRHPEISAENHQTIRWFVEHARHHFADCPAMLEIIDRGDDPAQDRRRP